MMSIQKLQLISRLLPHNNHLRNVWSCYTNLVIDFEQPERCCSVFRCRFNMQNLKRNYSSDNDKNKREQIAGKGEEFPDQNIITKIPRRLIKRLQKQGISENQFLDELNASKNIKDEHSQRYINTSNIKFTGSQLELDHLLRDMSVGTKDVPETDLFPSDMKKFKEMKWKRTANTTAKEDTKFKIDPASTSILLFPGQGSQFVGMGQKLLHFPGVNELYEEASSILGYNLLSLCLNGPKSELDKTMHCQVSVLITSLAALERLKEEHPKAIENCVATAGFSVGEFASLVFSDVLSFSLAVKVVKKRAEAMQKASEKVSSGMLSVFLTHDSDLKGALRTAKEYCIERRNIQDPVCQVANYLFPECKVIAGHTEALEFISANSKDFRLKRLKRLPVSGAFHTKLMKSAVRPLEDVFKNVDIGIPRLPVYSNLTGQPYNPKTNFAHKLCQQMVKPVKWEQTMHNIYSREPGVDFPQTFELGPSGQLGTLLKQVNSKAHQSYKCIEV